MEFCDLTTGRCGPAELPDEEEISLLTTARVQALFATDPVCSHCWALEPAWRRLQYIYGSAFTVRYIYGGLVPSWDNFSRGGITKPADLIPHFAEVAETYGQPIDSALWLDDPVGSSYPASIALHCVREATPEREDAYLRRLRQAVFLERRNIARTEVIADCAEEIGLNRETFLSQFEQGKGKAAFQQDLQEVRTLPVSGFPTLIFLNEENQGVVVRGTQSFSRLEQAFLRVAHIEPIASHPVIRDVLLAYGSGTTREFAEVLNLDHAATIEALTLASAHPTPRANDFLWSVL